MSFSSNPTSTIKELPFANEVLLYTTPQGFPIVPGSTVKDLGILISEDLSWNPHINEIARRATNKAGWVLNTFSDRSILTMKTLYKSLIRSLLEYCCPLWNPQDTKGIQSRDWKQFKAASYPKLQVFKI